MVLHVIRPYNLIHVPGRISPKALERDIAVASLTSGLGVCVRDPEEELQVEIDLDGGHGRRVEQEAVEET
ncbi:hypothetical protein PT974_10815 [Cladobotryum mycophilum]|uniref:Uncharacterized protein n=1 Tax=Cladobotryum mycophilum TaxID=491253 RepID=A0ABR0SAW2_9HYPO